MRFPFRGLTVAFALLAGACTGIIGVRDIFLDENAKPAGDAGPRDGEAADSPGGGEDGGTDAPITCTADLQTDLKNCGACGHDCSNGICDTGLCILAQDLKSPRSIAVRGGTVYVSLLGGNVGSIVSCPTSGCANAAVGTKLLTTGDAGDPYLWLLVATDTHVWASDYSSSNRGGVRRISVNGGDFRRLPAAAPTLDRSYGVAVDNASVYWTTNGSPGSVQWCNLPDCANGLQTAAVANDAEDLVVAANGTIIWAENSGGILKRCASKTACTPVDLVPDFQGVENDLKLDGDTVYWGTNLGEILSCPVSGCANPKKLVLEEPKATIGAIAVSGNTLYWSSMEFEADGNNVKEAEGKIKTCTMPKCTTADIRTIATNQHDPNTMTVDAKSVYWGNSGKRFFSDGIGNMLKAAR